MAYIFNQMMQLTRFACTNCESGTFTYSKEIQRGLQSSFIFVCGDCGNTLVFKSCPTYDDAENINISAILGITAIGLGHYHLQEFLAHLNVPSMSYVTYHKYEEDKIQKEYFKLCKQLEAEALNEEIRLAREHNEVDAAGNALISVEFDGSWEKRAYTGNFSSLAGCAAIIGLRTNKILYSEVKTKYCHICKIAESRSVTPQKHNCQKNFDGPSSGMETQIIIDGFKYCATKGARFNRYVGDGDSSTYKALRDLQLYKDPYIPIEKFECVNHLFRNFFKQWKTLLKSSKVNLKGRKLLNLEIGRNICKGIRLAAKHWRESNVEMAQKYFNLENDVMNAFLHYMGFHDNCAEYYCSKTTTAEALDTITILKKTGVYYEVLDLCQSYFGNNVKSLVAGLCTNKTEGFNSLIAKTLAGKRVCNSMAGSYKLRTNIAGVQFNSNGHSGSRIQEHIFGKSAPILKKLEHRRKRKCLDNTIAKQNRPKEYTNDGPSNKKKQKKHYGDGREEVDMTESQFECAKIRHFRRLSDNQMDRDIIQIETLAQHHSFKWSETRRIMLTSSYFGRVLNVRSRNSYTQIVSEILYNNVQYANTAEMRHQRLYEKVALPIFTGLYPFEPVTKCGIFIDEEISFLGASPFMLYGDNGIVAIKCPKKAFGKCMNDALKTISFWTGTATDRRINYKSHWYYEIQGQLHITRKQMAYLVIYLGDTYEVVEIEKNDEFWKEKMEKELVYFYNEALLKEIVNPREERAMDLRKYNSKKEIFE
ncbi:hypothetical protein HA402_009342 [Bradysia odoriphaga]|nr:hypothetical protein HA402_009342 [Bradysia odoriphaga]